MCNLRLQVKKKPGDEWDTVVGTTVLLDGEAEARADLEFQLVGWRYSGRFPVTAQWRIVREW
jgi:hypothetical protein